MSQQINLVQWASQVIPPNIRDDAILIFFDGIQQALPISLSRIVAKYQRVYPLQFTQSQDFNNQTSTVMVHFSWTMNGFEPISFGRTTVHINLHPIKIYSKGYLILDSEVQSLINMELMELKSIIATITRNLTFVTNDLWNKVLSSSQGTSYVDDQIDFSIPSRFPMPQRSVQSSSQLGNQPTSTNDQSLGTQPTQQNTLLGGTMGNFQAQSPIKATPKSSSILAMYAPSNTQKSITNTQKNVTQPSSSLPIQSSNPSQVTTNEPSDIDDEGTDEITDEDMDLAASAMTKPIEEKPTVQLDSLVEDTEIPDSSHQQIDVSKKIQIPKIPLMQPSNTRIPAVTTKTNPIDNKKGKKGK